MVDHIEQIINGLDSQEAFDIAYFIFAKALGKAHHFGLLLNYVEEFESVEKS